MEFDTYYPGKGGLYMEFLQLCVTSLVSFGLLFLEAKIIGRKQIAQLDFFDYITGITIGSIAAEMAEAPFRSDHYYALFATGIVLFLMTLAFNMIASRIAEKHRQVGSASL